MGDSTHGTMKVTRLSGLFRWTLLLPLVIWRPRLWLVANSEHK